MSYNYNINETTSLKHVINVNSKISNKKNEENMVQDYKVDSFENPENSVVITLVPERKPFSYHKKKTVVKISKNNLNINKEDSSKILKKNEENVKDNKKNSLLFINKYQTVKYINKGEEFSRFRILYDKKKNVVSFMSELLKYKDSKINNIENDIKDNNLISNILPNLSVFKENYNNKINISAKISYSSFCEDSKKSTNIYSNKDINFDISKGNKNLKVFNELNKKKPYKCSKLIEYENILENTDIDPVSIDKPSNIKGSNLKKVVYKHDSKVVHMNGFPLHHRCCEFVSEVNDEIKNNKGIEEVDDKGNEWKLLNDANESFPLVKFGKDIRDHFDYLNRSDEEDLHKVFMSELGNVEMSIDGKSITENKDPKEILKKFKELLPNISDRKLVSCFSQEGVLSKAFFGLIAKNPDILKCTFYHPKISYKINRINENSFEVDICSITRSRNFDDFNNVGMPYVNKIHSYGIKTNVVFSKISNPIIKNLFFVK
ncbi:hypothetical protein RJK19_02005 [Buchnera aphidicola (Ceratovacuna keduensis)]|uniref:hypothetical protein n=1 Tax=Buchnera aphidicola TaxID=9 RepID=UPI0031B80511